MIAIATATCTMLKYLVMLIKIKSFKSREDYWLPGGCLHLRLIFITVSLDRSFNMFRLSRESLIGTEAGQLLTVLWKVALFKFHKMAANFSTPLPLEELPFRVQARI